LADVELLDQMFESLGCLNRVKVFPLKVFDERDFQSLFFYFSPQQALLSTLLLSRTPATFSNNQLVSLSGPSDDERLQNSFLFDGLRQFLEFRFVKMLSRLRSIGDDLFDPTIEECFRFRLPQFGEKRS
jgi:hypothetical protein